MGENGKGKENLFVSAAMEDLENTGNKEFQDLVKEEKDKNTKPVYKEDEAANGGYNDVENEEDGEEPEVQEEVKEVEELEKEDQESSYNDEEPELQEEEGKEEEELDKEEKESSGLQEEGKEVEELEKEEKETSDNNEVAPEANEENQSVEIDEAGVQIPESSGKEGGEDAIGDDEKTVNSVHTEDLKEGEGTTEEDIGVEPAKKKVKVLEAMIDEN